MVEYIRKELMAMCDKGDYAKFTSSLIPGCDNIIGIRQPVLKKYAKQLVKDNEDFRSLLKEKDIYHEETILRAYVLGMGTAKEKDFNKALEDLKEFIPFVNNWAVNDCFCVEFRVIDKYRDEFLPYIKECIASGEEFRARVGLILLLDHYVKVDINGNKQARLKKVTLADIKEGDNPRTGRYIDEILKIADRDFAKEGYYTQMAAGWLLAECFVTYPAKVYEFLCDKDNLKLDTISYRKAVNKICESLTPEKEVKLKVRQLMK